MLSSTQRKLRDYGIFLGILIFVFAILFALVMFSRQKWYDGLKTQVQSVLDREYPARYAVGPALAVNSVMSVSSACYNLADTQNKYSYAFIVRIATVYGPQAAVFVANNDISGDEISFVGFACVDEEANFRIAESAKKSQIDYWKKQIQVLKNEAK